MANDQATTEKKSDPKKWFLLLLVFLLIFTCVFGYRALGVSGRLFSPDEEQGSANQGAGPEDAGQSDATTANSSEGDESAKTEPEGQVNPVDFNDPVYFTGVEFADPMNLDVEFLEASAYADGSAVLTFGTSSGAGGNGNGLPPGEYTANVDTGTGEALTYECGLNSAEPNKIYCYGPAIAKNTPVVADLSYTSSDFVLAGQVKGVLANATASNLPFDFSNLNKAAETLGLGEVDNPYEAWGVIGCCIQNISPDGLPEGCEAAVGDLLPSTSSNGNSDPMDTIIGNTQQEDAESNASATDAEQAWQALMDQYNAPQNWTGSPGSLNSTAQQAIFDNANACAAAMGYPLEEIDNLSEARAFFDMMWLLDPRRETSNGPGGIWGAITDFFGGIVDSVEALFEYFTGGWPDDWGILGDASNLIGSVWDKTFGGLLSTVLNSACLVFTLDDSGVGDTHLCDEFSETMTGSETYWNQFGGGGESPTPTPSSEFPPLACLEYIDYAKEHTYFAAASSNFIGSEYNYLGTPLAYCAEAMGFGYTPDEIKPYMDNDYMYDKIIAAYGYAGNPAMPDPCRMVVQWCDSDQYGSGYYQATGQAVVENSFEGGFSNLNGCNDPQSYAEAAAWTGSTEAPDCSDFEQAEAAIDVFNGLLGIDTKEDLYCYQVTAFENSPIGDVAACAERLGYSGSPMYTAGEYLDFLAWIGTMDSLDNKLEWSDECWTAIDFAKRFGFVEQSIDTAASSCAQGGPQILNTSPVEFTMPGVIVPVYDSGGKKNKGGGNGGNCQPDGTFCPLGGGLWGVIQNCSCKEVN